MQFYLLYPVLPSSRGILSEICYNSLNIPTRIPIQDINCIFRYSTFDCWHMKQQKQLLDGIGWISDCFPEIYWETKRSVLDLSFYICIWGNSAYSCSPTPATIIVASCRFCVLALCNWSMKFIANFFMAVYFVYRSLPIRRWGFVVKVRTF